MAKREKCKWCGEWFDKLGNARYCSKECSTKAEKYRNEMYWQNKRERNKAKKTSQTVVGVSIDDMVAVMQKLSKERGRVVQYGEVQKMLASGRIKVKDGAVI